jgi:hypothetical protein
LVLHYAVGKAKGVLKGRKIAALGIAQGTGTPRTIVALNGHNR